MSYKYAIILAILPALALGASIITAIEDPIVGGQACDDMAVTGAFINVHLDGCTQSPCLVSANGVYQIGLTFMPLANIRSVIWSPFVYNSLGGVFMYDDKLKVESLNATSAYLIYDTVAMRPQSFHPDGLGQLYIMLLNGETNVPIACGSFNIIVQ